MAKAKKKTSRVSPPIPVDDKKYSRYEDLTNGECFLWGGRLMMKWDVNDQEAYDLNGEGYKDMMCDEVVIPVDVKITWKKK